MTYVLRAKTVSRMRTVVILNTKVSIYSSMRTEMIDPFFSLDGREFDLLLEAIIVGSYPFEN